MSAYALQPLLRIRTMREDRASGELVAARQAVASAESDLEARRKDLEEFRATCEDRRNRIYETVMGRTVSREQLDLVNEGVARIDEEGVLKADNVKRAEGVLHERERAAETARANFVLASKNRMKIDEHKAVWRIRDAMEQESRAEGELEDFIARKLEI